MLIKKSILTVCGGTCAILVTVVCIPYFALQICINPTRNTFLVPKKPQKLTKFEHISSIILSCLKLAK